MYALGHYGMALLLFAAVGYVLVSRGYVQDALYGGGLVVSFTRIPDIDTELDFLIHRGVTHTMWFAVGVGLFCVLVVANSLRKRPRREAVLGAGWAFFLGTLSIVAHLIGDVITPWGVMPLYPLTPALYTFDLVYAKNPAANYALLTAGICAVSVAWVAADWSGPRRSLPYRAYRRLRGRRRIPE